MLSSFKDITETLKRGVALGLRTKVIYQDGETGDVTELFSSFPENLALTFCPSLTIKRVQKHGKTIVVTGVNAGAYLSVFEWIYACADVKKVIAFPNFPDLVYYRAIYVEKAAKILGIAELVEGMRKRMASIARKQVHTDDVNKIYRDPACADYKEAVTQSIARAIFEKRVAMEGQVNRLRREMPHVNDDIKYELECLKPPRQKV
jgi:hypothetical protein